MKAIKTLIIVSLIAGWSSLASAEATCSHQKANDNRNNNNRVAANKVNDLLSTASSNQQTQSSSRRTVR